MSAFNDIDLACEACGHEFRATLWTAVDAKEDPELKGLLLGGELNLIQCPACSRVAYQDHFVLYQDPAAELVAYVYPPGRQSEETFLRQTMLSSFQEAESILPAGQRKGYEPVLLFGLESLVEMMSHEALRAEQSQIAQAICQEKGIPFAVLRPSEARRLGTLRVLPLAAPNAGPDRKNVLHGLKRLLTEDPALDLYVRLQADVEEDPSWTARGAGMDAAKAFRPPTPSKSRASFADRQIPHKKPAPKDPGRASRR